MVVFWTKAKPPKRSLVHLFGHQKYQLKESCSRSKRCPRIQTINSENEISCFISSAISPVSISTYDHPLITMLESQPGTLIMTFFFFSKLKDYEAERRKAVDSN